MHCRKYALIFPLILGLCAAQARANLTIIPTYENSITGDPNAQMIENTIQSAINVYDSHFSNPITIKIDFANISTGLGQSATSLYVTDYSSYRTALINTKTAGTDNTAFLAYLPASGDPIPGQSNSKVESSSAALRALGFNTLGSVNVNGVNYDSQVSLNMGLMNLSRTGVQDPGKYDLQTVVMHEIDEALGVNSALDTGIPTGYVGPMDFFRYNGNGSRSFTKATSEQAYFSIDGGQTRIVYFNQGASGGDLNDWASNGESYASSTPQVQDAFGTPGSAPNLGPAELTALDVIGYNSIAAAPEPSSLSVLGIVVATLFSALWRKRRQKPGKTEA